MSSRAIAGDLRQAAGAAVLLFAFFRPEALMAHGEIHLRILELTRQIQAMTNNLAPLYLERGELEREHGVWDAAAADYDLAAKLDPRLARVDLCRARLLADRGELAAAKVAYDRAVARSPTDGEGFLGRGRVEARLGQVGAAITDFQRGIELLKQPRPEDVLQLARLLAAEEDPKAALRALDDGMRKLGMVISLQEYAIDLDLKRRDIPSALARVESILARVPRKETWFARRGDILARAGKAREARQSYEASLAAIRQLPAILQQSPPLLKLASEVQAAVATLQQ